ncbi:alpha/beta hydrolase [Nonlabens xiamenensis]|uniref:alpha/beta hydrolase n=1 Tax=Nonlabens xiamenensis TaxID=2341043 RepID=UPI000F60F575|nr:alpha/beta hydrolase [Nonlabens xiamenensis]
MKHLIVLFLFISPVMLLAQNVFSKEYAQQNPDLREEVVIGSDINGSLWLPEIKKRHPLLIMIGGSGVVDRNGNEPRSKSFHLQQLADSLAVRGVATFRYDKRTFTQMKMRKNNESTLFTDFVKDAREVIRHFSEDPRFTDIYVLGHDQGSLVAMLAAEPSVKGIISIAGAGESIDQLIIRQIAGQQPGLDKVARETFARVKQSDKPVEQIERDLYMIIGPPVQDFMKSWMAFDPAHELTQLSIPTLLINGSYNRQVDTLQTKLLKKAAPKSKLLIIKEMNHVLKKVPEDEIMASKSYVNPNFPLHPELIASILEFIESEK